MCIEVTVIMSVTNGCLMIAPMAFYDILLGNHIVLACNYFQLRN
jgi:hypothetical protein